ncbi:ethanolamine-phosphate phospho-lyase-like [Daphnia pulex]|uniref:ethanolamine-phosphate phospho-lyase-like n=1 Tax=Daphnia pulex TaxID=6669 RepID=UPI001EDD217C|nr:ethanolamine-phosphate phospho-lyase-like [Daphnia pulex]
MQGLHQFSTPSDNWCQVHFANSEIKVARASKQYIYDDLGTEYLDCVSSSAHVGHCHPHVVAASQTQMQKLWTTQGFLNDTYSLYMKKLMDVLPESLSVVYLVNSGSEANDLALRLGRLYTKRDDVAIFESSYHGNISSLVDVSSKSFKRLPQGKKEFVHVIPLPKCQNIEDQTVENEQANQEKFCEDAQRVIENASKNGRSIGILLSEMVISAAGLVIPPLGYFKNLYQMIRNQGGICIADEVQTSLGRIGGDFWAFQLYGVVPDILTFGKSIGNGFPIAAVVTSREIASCLPEYMNTYGGNPLACAIGKAVLEVIVNEKLMYSAKMVGKSLLEGLRGLMSKHPSIGDVRGMGLCVGVEVVCGRPDMKPATILANRILYLLKEEKVIVATQGEERNVIALTPPLCFTLDNARRVVEAFDKAFTKANQSEESEPVRPNTSFLGLDNIPLNVMGGDEETDTSPAKRQRTYEEMD